VSPRHLPGGRDLYLVYPKAAQDSPSQTLPIRVYSNDSVRKPSINRLQVAVASVSIPFPISFGRTMYLAMASAHESAPGRGRRLHRESTVLHYSHHGQNYEKRALMHHSSSLCSFSRDRSECAPTESASSPLFQGLCCVQSQSAHALPCSIFAPFPKNSVAPMLALRVFYQENVVSRNVCSPLSFVVADVSCTASQCSSELRCM
jgi:hypothetical protein